MLNLSKETIYKLTHELIDEFCGQNSPQVNDYVPQFWVNYEDFQNFSNCLKKCIQISFDTKHNVENEVLNQVPEKYRKFVIESIELRKSEIKNETINRAILNCFTYLLKDFDWQIKMIFSSDQLCQINEPLVNLDLLLQAKLPQNSKVISIEMNKSELSKLISVLEKGYHDLK